MEICLIKAYWAGSLGIRAFPASVVSCCRDPRGKLTDGEIAAIDKDAGVIVYESGAAMHRIVLALHEYVQLQPNTMLWHASANRLAAKAPQVPIPADADAWFASQVASLDTRLREVEAANSMAAPTSSLDVRLREATITATAPRRPTPLVVIDEIEDADRPAITGLVATTMPIPAVRADYPDIREAVASRQIHDFLNTPMVMLDDPSYTSMAPPAKPRATCRNHRSVLIHPNSEEDGDAAHSNTGESQPQT